VKTMSRTFDLSSKISEIAAKECEVVPRGTQRKVIKFKYNSRKRCGTVPAKRARCQKTLDNFGSYRSIDKFTDIQRRNYFILVPYSGHKTLL
jgi:hypothetical protein